MRRIIHASLFFTLLMFGIIMFRVSYISADETNKLIRIGEEIIVDPDGNIIGNLPTGINYDYKNHKLTINSFNTNDSLEAYGDLILETKGNNTIKGGVSSDGELKIYGGGSLNTGSVLSYHKMELNNVTINVAGTNKDYSFYGLELVPWQNYYEGYKNCYIKIVDSTVNINNTVTYGKEIYNIGIDAQDADLIIQNSKVDMVLKNGVTWGYLTGLYFGQCYGGLFEVDEKSNIKFQAINSELSSDELYATYFYKEKINAKYIYTGKKPNGVLTSKSSILNTHSWLEERSECLAAFMEMTPTYRENDNGTNGTSYSNKVSNPSKPSIKKIKAKKKALKITWKRVNGINGYKIQYSSKKNFKGAKTKVIKNATTTSVTIKKLKRKKKYYVRIRAYKVVSGKTYQSGWSKAKSKKTK